MKVAGPVVVTGAAGFVGIPVVRRLLGRGYEVVALDSFVGGDRRSLNQLAAENGHLGIVEHDIRDRRNLSAVVANIKPWGLVHLAALHFIPFCIAHPDETLAVNVGGVESVLAAADVAGVARLVFTSTADVYRPSASPHAETAPTQPNNVYGRSKLQGEQLIRSWRQHGARTAPLILRLFNVYGPGETNPHVLPEIFRMLRDGDTLRLGNTHPRRDYIFVEDVAEVIVSLLDAPVADQVVNVGTGHSWSVNDLVDQLRSLTGRDLRIDYDPAKVRPTDRPNLQADIGRLRRLLPDLDLTRIAAGLAATLRSDGVVPATATVGSEGRY